MIKSWTTSKRFAKYVSHNKINTKQPETGQHYTDGTRMQEWLSEMTSHGVQARPLSFAVPRRATL